MHACGAPFVYPHGDGNIEFPLFDAKEYEGLINQCRAKMARVSRSNADQDNLVGVERTRFLTLMDMRGVGAEDLASFLNDYAESVKVLRKSLEKNGRSTEEAAKIIASIPQADVGWLAKIVSGLVVVQPKKKEVENGE